MNNIFSEGLPSDFHLVQKVARSTFSDRFCLKYKPIQCDQLCLIVYIQKKETTKNLLKFCAEWKSTLIDLNILYFRV